MKLTPEQVNIIRKQVDQSAIKIESLRDDILDHLCCVVEMLMSKGKSYEHSLQEALHDLAPNGLDEIQHKTVFLLNSNKIILMKKLMYLIGLGSSIAMAMGLCFKILDWLGGNELIIYGFISFTLLFLPMTMIDKLKLKIQKSLSEKLRFILGSLSAIATGLAVVFKILHLQGADFLLLGGAVIFSFGFLPFLFFTNYKKAVEQHL